MGLPWPNYPDHIAGDEQTESPTKHQQSLLAAERGTNLARRLETDASRNLYVNVASGSIVITPSGVQDVNIVSSIAIPVTDNGGSLTVDVSSLPLPAGAATEATLLLVKAKTDNLDVLLSTRTKPSDTQLVDGSAHTQPISAAALPLPTGAATEATLAMRLADATFTGRINTLGQKTMANSTPVVIASDQSAISVTVTTNAGTAVVTRVPTSTTVATALAANANRTGFIISSEGGATFIKFGSGATTTDYTVDLAGNSEYEYKGYKGIVTVIRQTGTGNIQVTEVS